MSQARINHHYVPAGLLKKWYGDHIEGRNDGYRKYERNHEGEIKLNPHNISANSNCFEKDLNTTYFNLFSHNQELIKDTNSFEKELGDLDTKGLEIINKILKANDNFKEGDKDIFQQLDTEQKKLLCKFLLSLHVRHPKTLEHVRGVVKKHASSAIELIKSYADQINLSEHAEFYHKTSNLIAMREILNKESSINAIFSMNWYLIEAQTVEFFTGERPFITNFKENDFEIQVGFAVSLSPKVLMIGMHKKLLEGDLIKQINYIQEFVPFYNILVCKQSKRGGPTCLNN